ncbi:MAG: hypothetical protein ABI210_12580, partial [Abditibacteriaceae bacterium]
LSTTGLSINGKTVSAVGIPKLPVNQYFLSTGDINLIDAGSAEIIGADGEYAPFGEDTAMTPIKSTFMETPQGVHTGHVMLETADGNLYEAIHQGVQVFAVVHKDALELPLVNGAYVPPASMSGSKLVMLMDDGRQFEMSSTDGKLYVDLPDGNKSLVQF